MISRNAREALFYDKLDDGRVRCRLCPNLCVIGDGSPGRCMVRKNESGKLFTHSYGNTVTVAIDPIEKKPLYHFYPGTQITSTGANGCNLKCLHCQNWTISQEETRTTNVTPEQLVQAALDNDSIGIAFTYTEPMIWFEYIMDAAPLCREVGLKVVLVTNGYVNEAPLEELLAVTDAMNVDLKGIRPEFYKRICKGKIEPILSNIRRIAGAGVHLEVTNLVIPTLNDADDDLSALADFVASVSEMIPLHLSAYRPEYKLDIPATPLETLLRAQEIAEKRLKYVYLGNVRAPGGGDTRCPSCGSLLINGSGYRRLTSGLDGTRCRACGFETGIIR